MFHKELSEQELNGMSDKELNKYFKQQTENTLRDKFAMAALTGLISNENWINNIDDTVDDAYVIADAMMEERIK